MTSPKATKANRKNAAKSTGPTSPQGKEIVASNAVKHGLAADSHMLLEGESANDYKNLHSFLRMDLRPIGVLEEELVGRIVDLMWRLRRTSLIETGILNYAYYNRLRTLAETKLIQLRARGAMTGFAPTENVKLAEKDLEEATEKRDEEVSMLGHGFIEDSEERNALAKLSRYETTLWNQLLKAMVMLRSLQEQRLTPVKSESTEDW